MTQPQSGPVLSLEDVSLVYRARQNHFEGGYHTVLSEISLALYEGETLGIIGRNGAGKTTLLQLMAGILAPSSGEVKRVKGKSASLLTIGLGFRYDLTGRDNAVLSAMLQGSTKKQALSYLEEIGDFAELGDSFDEPVRTYSAGMLARLGFSIALKTQVDILLIDEVLSVGDTKFRTKAFSAMEGRLSSDQTVVLVSHSESHIEQLCDRAIWIDKAGIRGEGSTASVLAAYRDS